MKEKCAKPCGLQVIRLAGKCSYGPSRNRREEVCEFSEELFEKELEGKEKTLRYDFDLAENAEFKFIRAEQQANSMK